MTNYLPKVLEFTDLHLKKGRKAAKLALKGLSGIYAIIHIPSGRVYIGSSINLARRLAEHLGYGKSNRRLKNSMAKHGLEDFIFCVVELYSVDPEVSNETNQANLLALEQPYLVWLFSLSEEFRFNFAKVAEAPFTGLTHIPETRAKISEANTGKIRTPETLVKMSEAKSGANNPIYGCTHTPETLAKMSVAQS